MTNTANSMTATMSPSVSVSVNASPNSAKNKMKSVAARGVGCSVTGMGVALFVGLAGVFVL